MMVPRGHTVFLYSGGMNDAPCAEHIPCAPVMDVKDYISVSWDSRSPLWSQFNAKVVEKIKERAEPHDIICVIGGIAHKPIADAFPEMITCEFGIGYGGTFAKYRVFESYAWMHTVYGAQSGGNAHAIDGRWFDAVIPNYFNVPEFPFKDIKDDYYLYIGRIIERKGYAIAQQVCEKLGKRLIVAGQGKLTGYGEHVGEVGPIERGELMSNAIATFVPTIYVEPFGGVAVESMLCGTPVITTDWGAFTETVTPGMGFRCRSFRDFCQAAECAPNLDPYYIRREAVAKYSTDAVADMYEDYFSRLLTLWDKGWYA
jgi:glycosyltransferase involved in cell wall biosynthesis